MGALEQAVMARLKGEIAGAEYARWLAPLIWDFDAEKRALALTAPTIFHQKWVGQKYAGLILKAAEDLGHVLSVFEVRGPEPAPGPAFIYASSTLPAASGAAARSEQTFDDYIVHPSNKLAALALENFCLGYEHLAAKIVLVLATGPWGKTHLLNAAVQRLNAAGTPLLKLGPAEPRPEQWDRARLIIVDDIHLLAGRQESQARLISAFDEAAAGRLRLLISAPAPPVKLAGLSEPLRSRLAGGLILKIEPPEFDIMTGLAARYAARCDFAAAEEQLVPLAREAAGDPRALEGMVGTAAHLVRHCGFSPAEATAAVTAINSPGAKIGKVPIEAVINGVAASFSLKPADIIGHSKLRQAAWPRRVAMFLARELTGLTTSDIGKSFSGRDHSTVIHALKKINEELSDPARMRLVENIKRDLIVNSNPGGDK